MSVLVFADSSEGKFKKAAFEAVSYGKKVAEQLGTTITAVTMNANNSSELATYGADKIVTVENLKKRLEELKKEKARVEEEKKKLEEKLKKKKKKAKKKKKRKNVEYEYDPEKDVMLIHKKRKRGSTDFDWEE